MSKDDRSGLNPFTGKSHYDNVDDDKFLNEYYNHYYDMINKYEILDQTQQGQLILKVTSNLINAVEKYLAKRFNFKDIDIKRFSLFAFRLFLGLCDKIIHMSEFEIIV